MKVTDEMVCMACAKFDSLANESQLIAMKAAIEAAMQAAWVSVKDRMPDEYDDVLIKDDQGEYQYAYRKGINWIVEANHYDVTHWMPLPEYKGE